MAEATEDYEIRARIASEGARALILINGAGIIALLGFLSTVWRPDNEGIIVSILDGIWFLAIALVLAASNYPLRYWASRTHRKGKVVAHRVFETIEWAVVAASFGLFIWAVIALVGGAKAAIP